MRRGGDRIVCSVIAVMVNDCGHTHTNKHIHNSGSTFLECFLLTRNRKKLHIHIHAYARQITRGGKQYIANTNTQMGPNGTELSRFIFHHFLTLTSYIDQLSSSSELIFAVPLPSSSSLAYLAHLLFTFRFGLLFVVSFVITEFPPNVVSSSSSESSLASSSAFALFRLFAFARTE